MSDNDEAPARDSSLSERATAVETFIDAVDHLTIVGNLEWSAVESDYRLLAINHVLRRQRESIQAAIALSRTGLGHLAVTFVRPAVEERIWINYLSSLDLTTSQELVDLMGKYDVIRSLVAQREYIGDDAMRALWYPQGFVDAQEKALQKITAALKALGKLKGWNGALPASSWVAKEAGLTRDFEYLFAATSRAVHFSAGEIMRRGWGTPGGIMITDKPEFREHVANFALDQLWRLYMDTMSAGKDLLDRAGLSSDPAVVAGDFTSAVNHLLTFGKVPLVHAAEWNLAHEGPLSNRPDGD
jgi:hypothetical protein